MTFSVRYVPGDRTINLHQATPADLALITELHDGRPWRENRHVFQCLETGGDPDMFIRRLNGRYHFAHFAGGSHGSHEVVPESDGHKRQKDYVVRPALAAGLNAVTEFKVKGGRLDVAITGGAVDVDIEPQRYERPVGHFMRRTTIYRNAGFLTAWFSNLGAVPGWLSGVPAFGCNAQPWNEYLPAPHSVTATPASPSSRLSGAYWVPSTAARPGSGAPAAGITLNASHGRG